MYRPALRGVGAAGRRPSPPPSRPSAPIPAFNGLKRPGARPAPLDSQGGPADPRAGGGQFTVTPWGVSGEIDYDLLVEQLGTARITDALRGRVRRAAGEDHFMLRRGVFFSHCDFGRILDVQSRAPASTCTRGAARRAARTLATCRRGCLQSGCKTGSACACNTMLVIKSGRSRRPHFRTAIFLATRAPTKNGVHFGHIQLRGEKRAGGAGFSLFSGPKARAARQRRRAGSSSGWRQR